MSEELSYLTQRSVYQGSEFDPENPGGCDNVMIPLGDGRVAGVSAVFNGEMILFVGSETATIKLAQLKYFYDWAKYWTDKVVASP